MSVSVEAISTPTEEIRNLPTTTDSEPTEGEVNELENGVKSADIVAPRGKSLSYTKDECLAVKDAWLSNVRPAALSDKYCNREGVWDPELWYYSSESENRSASPINDAKKRYLLDGIVLSPQGRSFVRGCQVNAGKQDHDGRSEGRNKTSGRLGRGWEGREKTRERGRSSPTGDMRFERNFRNERNDVRNDGKTRRRTNSLEAQPEWFTHGPTSQQETIELRGFDDADKGNKRKKRRKDEEESSAVEETKQNISKEVLEDSQTFDINSFFDMAENALPISGMYDSQATGSRFSQWFGRPRSRSNSLNASQSNSRRSSIADELAEIAGLTLSSPVRTPSPDSDNLFTPIMATSDSCEDNLMNIIQDSDVDVQPLLDSVIPHKTVKGAVTLEDLECEGGVAIDDEDKKVHGTKDTVESQVFLRLVQTMKDSGNLPAKPTPTIPDIPPHLLPRPPSAKDKGRTVSRSPSPLQLLQEVIRRSQSPVGFVNHAQPEPQLRSSFDARRTASPVNDVFSPLTRARPLTPEDLYGAPPVFNVDTSGPDLFKFTGSAANIEQRVAGKKKAFQPRYSCNVEISSEQTPKHSGGKPNANYPAISQAFVPTSVLRKYHCDKHDQKSSDGKETKQDSSPTLNDNLQRQHTSSPKLCDSSQATSSSPTLMSPHEFTSPKTSLESTGDTLSRPEVLTPHRLPIPSSPSLTPHSLPLPSTPHDTPRTSSDNPTKSLLTPRSLPLPQSPLVSSANSNPASDFGIRPLAKTSGSGMNDRVQVRGNQGAFRKPFDPRQNNMRRFPQGKMPYRGQVPITPNMIPRPGMIPSPFNMNAARAMNVHPTALALALRNQQYQMARAAAVAAATAAVNRPPLISPAQAAAAAMMLNQQRAQGFHGIMPPVNPRMYSHNTQRPNLPPALQRQHHVVHHSEPGKDNSLSKWFSDAVLNQSQAQSASPGRGAKVMSVEELERRHTCV